MISNDENLEKNSNVEDIEVVIGDNSGLEISEVGDCMNDLRPKDSEKNKKQVIIPKAKNKEEQKEEKKEDENSEN